MSNKKSNTLIMPVIKLRFHEELFEQIFLSEIFCVMSGNHLASISKCVFRKELGYFKKYILYDNALFVCFFVVKLKSALQYALSHSTFT